MMTSDYCSIEINDEKGHKIFIPKAVISISSDFEYEDFGYGLAKSFMTSERYTLKADLMYGDKGHISTTYVPTSGQMLVSVNIPELTFDWVEKAYTAAGVDKDVLFNTRQTTEGYTLTWRIEKM